MYIYKKAKIYTINLSVKNIVILKYGLKKKKNLLSNYSEIYIINNLI